MYIRGTIADYVADASSNKPAPGGGSISAMVAVLGTTMGSMAGNFTVGKKKFADVETEVSGMLDRLEQLRTELLSLVDEDVTAYSGIGKAYGMPRKTDEEKAARRAEIQKALVVAMDVPFRIMEACSEVMKLLAWLVDVANPNLISDVGVSAIVTDAGLRAAKLNVEINLAGLKDDEMVGRTDERISELADESAAVHDEVLLKVQRGIRGDG